MREIFFRRRADRWTCAPALCIRFRGPLRLFAAARGIQFLRSPTTPLPTTLTDAVHRFHESIAGRSYLIEVTRVAHDRWRAYIVRTPGVPTALMPFYGATPADAAKHLCDWLTRAYARAATPTGTV